MPAEVGMTMFENRPVPGANEVIAISLAIFVWVESKAADPIHSKRPLWPRTRPGISSCRK